jgi:hypothetical protein
LLHELLHIYEIYFRIKEDKKSLQWSIGKIIQDIRNKYVDDKFISDLWYAIYLSFNHEIGARVCETYTVLMDLMICDKKKLLDELSKTTAWKYKDYLKNWKVKHDIDYNLLLAFLTELNTEISKKFELNNKVFRIPLNEKDCDLIIKEWLVIFKKKSKYFEDKLIKVIDDVIFDVTMINGSTIKIENVNFINIYKKDLLRESKLNKLDREQY